MSWIRARSAPPLQPSSGETLISPARALATINAMRNTMAASIGITRHARQLGAIASVPGLAVAVLLAPPPTKNGHNRERILELH